MLTRRRFLVGFGALAAAAALPTPTRAVPVPATLDLERVGWRRRLFPSAWSSVGDGVHDDSAWLQAQLDALAATPGGGVLWAPHGSYLISRPLRLHGEDVTLAGLHVKPHPSFQGDALLKMEGRHNSLLHSRLESDERVAYGLSMTGEQQKIDGNCFVRAGIAPFDLSKYGLTLKANESAGYVSEMVLWDLRGEA